MDIAVDDAGGPPPGREYLDLHAPTTPRTVPGRLQTPSRHTDLVTPLSQRSTTPVAPRRGGWSRPCWLFLVCRLRIDRRHNFLRARRLRW